jgi:hypothetical protein
MVRVAPERRTTVWTTSYGDPTRSQVVSTAMSPPTVVASAGPAMRSAKPRKRADREGWAIMHLEWRDRDDRDQAWNRWDVSSIVVRPILGKSGITAWADPSR